MFAVLRQNVCGVHLLRVSYALTITIMCNCQLDAVYLLRKQIACPDYMPYLRFSASSFELREVPQCELSRQPLVGHNTLNCPAVLAALAIDYVCGAQHNLQDCALHAWSPLCSEFNVWSGFIH